MWLMALSGTSRENGDKDGLPWCALCLRKDGDGDGEEDDDGDGDDARDGDHRDGDGDGKLNVEEKGDLRDTGRTSWCDAKQHQFCWSCAEVCGGALLCRRGRCPLCRLAAAACGFDTLVQQSRPLRLPHPKEGWSGTQRLLLRGTLSVEDRCELTTAIAADRCRELRQSMRPKPKPKVKPKAKPTPAATEDAEGAATAAAASELNNPSGSSSSTPAAAAYDPSNVGEVMRAFARELPTHDDLPPGLCDELAVVSNSSALLGRNLGEEIDGRGCVVRFNEYVRGAGLGDYERHVGTRTTCHVISEQVLAEGGLSDEAMMGALRSTPMTLWMPPMAWGNSTYYSRYMRMLLGCAATDGLELTRGERRRVVLLRPSVSFAMWKYFRPFTWGRKENTEYSYDEVNQDANQADQRANAAAGGAGGAGPNYEEEEDDDERTDENGEEFDEARSRPGAGTTGFKFALLAMGISSRVWLYGFEDDPRNAVDAAGGHYFNTKHSQEAAYDIAWERQQLRSYEDMDYVHLVPTHKITTASG